ncbi:CbtA family protein [uncultured Litoreibacter sp.]|uniref:CbtA family protein n=1 Tax=uncultured Litoreibacter sp. TaxID=1392394 RepID=UPI00263869AE|nr:CbtA family protein [uncultured Litoreibacter sp.]
MLRQILTSAVFAGVGAGVLAALLQLWLVVPLIMEAELFESGQRVHFATDGSTQSDRGAPSVWEEPLRHIYTIGFSAVTFTAYAFFMVAGFALATRAGHEITAKRGMVWGLCGAIAVVIAPAIGMPPELPGAIGAEVVPRQVWYLSCVVLTLIGLTQIAFDGRSRVWITAPIFLLVPHLMGAPHLDTYFGVAPSELASEFVARVMGVAMISWVLLGLFAALIWTRSEEA